MSLRSAPVEERAILPDGRVVRVRVGVPEDSYIRRSDLDTVVVELIGEGEHLGAATTLLAADDDVAARSLAWEIVTGLERGELEPTAGAVEPLVDRLR